MIAAVLLAAVVSAAEFSDVVMVPIEQPIALVAPPGVAKAWDSFDRLPASETGGRAITIDGTVPPGPGRIDVLRRENQRWVWESRLTYESHVRLGGGRLRSRHPASIPWYVLVFLGGKRARAPARPSLCAP